MLFPSLSVSSAAHLGREAAEEGVPEVDEGEGEVLVEEVAQELAHAQVRPAAVNQQEALQEAELGEGVVAGQHGLHALLTRDAHTDVSRWVSPREGRTRKRHFRRNLHFKRHKCRKSSNSGSLVSVEG